MLKREGAIFTAFTGLLCTDFNSFHKYAEEIMGRPVFSHEFADESVSKSLKRLSESDFLNIVNNQTESNPSESIGYIHCTTDVNDILIRLITDGKLSRDQVESITIEMEAIRAVREATNYTLTK